MFKSNDFNSPIPAWGIEKGKKKMLYHNGVDESLAYFWHHVTITRFLSNVLILDSTNVFYIIKCISLYIHHAKINPILFKSDSQIIVLLNT